MARFWSYVASSGENRVLVPLLECGQLYSYTIPSFFVSEVLADHVTQHTKKNIPHHL